MKYLATGFKTSKWIKITHIYRLKHFSIFDGSIHSQYQWLYQLIKEIKKDYSHAKRYTVMVNDAPSTTSARLPVDEPALASIMTHDHAKDLCTSELSPLRI